MSTSRLSLPGRNASSIGSGQNWQFIYLGIWLASLLVGAWVLYMFYARLRDIGDELRKIRVTYEMEQERTIRNAARSRAATSSEDSSSGDARYMPTK